MLATFKELTKFFEIALKESLKVNQKLALFDKLSENIITQSQFLQKMGIIERTKILSKNMTSENKINLYTRLERLIDPRMMGEKFKVIFSKNKNCNFSLAFK